MDKLHALPVAGESFLMIRKGKKILVDAGYRSDKLSEELEKLDASVIDVAVCTHSDIDHARGFTGLFHKIQIKELWLPSLWLFGIVGMSKDLEKNLEGIIEEIKYFLNEIDFSKYDAESHLDFYKIASAEYANKYGGEIFSSEDFDISTYLEEIDRAGNIFYDTEGGMHFSRGLKIYSSLISKENLLGFSAPKTLFAKSIIKRAAIMTQIYFEAIRSGVKIRWFDFRSYLRSRKASGGENEYLIPLNSVETKTIGKISLNKIMQALTMDNKECLTFYSPSRASSNNPARIGVIFCGDSPLGTGIQHSTIAIDESVINDIFCIATVPHHGSEDNRVAYDHLDRVTMILGYLRAGGRRPNPGKKFRSISQSLRLCSWCPHAKYKLMLTSIDLDQVWYGFANEETRKCNC